MEFDEGEQVVEHPVAEFGPWGIGVPGENFVEAFGFVLTRVPFEIPGVYEFQMWVDGFDGPVNAERIEARGPS